jgi:DNA-binding LacI/PurR family transcriptional regulator
MASSLFTAKYKKVADFVRDRIVHGDYVLKPIPSERKLAAEMGLSYMTVRRALDILEMEDLILRQPNGRMRVKRLQQGAKKHLNFAFLIPTLASHALEMWRLALERATAQLSCTVRPILFMHWDDPTLLDAVEGFDGCFLNPIPEPLPENVAERLRRREHPVVVVDHDFSGYGIPSIELFPPVYVQRLLDHLDALGHRHIGCLNTQPDNSEIRERINQWRYWMAAHGFSGRFANHGVPAHGDPIQHAYHVMSGMLADGFEETAWFCTTAPAALGVMAAMTDRNVQPGRDIAVCAANGEGLAAMLNPALTALEASDPTPFRAVCLDWMLRGGRNWEGPLLMQPADVPLIIRESTQPGAGRQLPPPPALPSPSLKKGAGPRQKSKPKS